MGNWDQNEQPTYELNSWKEEMLPAASHSDFPYMESQILKYMYLVVLSKWQDIYVFVETSNDREWPNIMTIYF